MGIILPLMPLHLTLQVSEHQMSKRSERVQDSSINFIPLYRPLIRQPNVSLHSLSSFNQVTNSLQSIMTFIYFSSCSSLLPFEALTFLVVVFLIAFCVGVVFSFKLHLHYYKLMRVSVLKGKMGINHHKFSPALNLAPVS